jgi:hypothetical protein
MWWQLCTTYAVRAAMLLLCAGCVRSYVCQCFLSFVEVGVGTFAHLPQFCSVGWWAGIEQRSNAAHDPTLRWCTDRQSLCWC